MKVFPPGSQSGRAFPWSRASGARSSSDVPRFGMPAREKRFRAPLAFVIGFPRQSAIHLVAPRFELLSREAEFLWNPLLPPRLRTSRSGSPTRWPEAGEAVVGGLR